MYAGIPENSGMRAKSAMVRAIGKEISFHYEVLFWGEMWVIEDLPIAHKEEANFISSIDLNNPNGCEPKGFIPICGIFSLSAHYRAK